MDTITNYRDLSLALAKAESCFDADEVLKAAEDTLLVGFIEKIEQFNLFFELTQLQQYIYETAQQIHELNLEYGPNE